jgi:chemotaxis protein CheZ
LKNQEAEVTTDEGGRPHELGAAVPEQHDEFLARVGHMTRSLHESLRGLGLDKMIERAASDIPDARDRLDYVAQMSEQAAQRVLNATDAAGPLQDKIDVDANILSDKWKKISQSTFSETEYRAAAALTIDFLAQTRANTAGTKAYLLEIMMAQDFQDLTGQVIKRVTSIAENLEQQLVQLLIDFAPAEIRREVVNSGLLNGPQIKPEGNTEIVSTQTQVDDLLDSLGF